MPQPIKSPDQQLGAPLDRQDLHDLVREALENSMGPDWTITLGATCVIDALAEAGVI